MLFELLYQQSEEEEDEDDNIEQENDLSNMNEGDAEE